MTHRSRQRIGENEIGLYLVGDRYYAMENVCPHAYALLSQGFVEGDEVECPLHGARFHIPTGKCTQEPGGRDLVCYAGETRGRAAARQGRLTFEGGALVTMHPPDHQSASSPMGPWFGSLGVSCIICRRCGTVLIEKPDVT